MKKKVVTISAIVLIAVLVIAFVIAISCNVMVGKPEKTSNGIYYRTGCTSVALFGKMEIAGVDKVVISSAEKSMTITDTDLVNRIVGRTKVATWAYNTGCGCCELRDWTIDLYCGDKLMRSMEWLEDDVVKVYDPDLTHWVFPVERQQERSIGGYALLSEELEAELVKMFVNA